MYVTLQKNDDSGISKLEVSIVKRCQILFLHMILLNDVTFN